MANERHYLDEGWLHIGHPDYPYEEIMNTSGTPLTPRVGDGHEIEARGDEYPADGGPLPIESGGWWTPYVETSWGYFRFAVHPVEQPDGVILFWHDAEGAHSQSVVTDADRERRERVDPDTIDATPAADMTDEQYRVWMAAGHPPKMPRRERVDPDHTRESEIAAIEAALIKDGTVLGALPINALATVLYRAGLGMRRERVDPDLLRLIELIGDRDIYVRSPEGLTTRIRFGKGEPDVPLDSRTGLPLGHGHFATSESVGGLIDRLNLIAPGMVTIHEGAAADIPKGERLGSLTPAERKGRGRGWRLRAPL